MAIFSNRKGVSRPVRAVTSVTTELDQQWFRDWVTSIRTAKGDQAFCEVFEAPSVDEATETLMGRTTGVIDHYCRDYVSRYCERAALENYVAKLDAALSPWDLVAFVISLGPPGRSDWEGLVVGAVKPNLERMAEIIIDPSVVK
jgi:hypothetical protein